MVQTSGKTGHKTSAKAAEQPSRERLPKHCMSRRFFLGGLACTALITAAPLPLPAGEQISILAATYPAFLACDTLLRDMPGIRLDLLVGAQTGCPHDYSMTPQDRMKLEEAHLFVMTGAGYEPFLDTDLLKRLSCQVVDCSRGLDLKDDEKDEHADHDDAGKGHHHGGLNPHYFSSPRMFAQMVQAVAGALCEKFPAMQPELAKRSGIIAESMKQLADGISLLGSSKVHLVLQHDTLSWFFKDSRCRTECILQEDDGEAPSAAMLLELIQNIKKAREAGEQYLLVGDSQYSDQVLTTLAKESGAGRIVLDSLVSGPVPVPAGYYEKTMRSNIELVRQALQA